MYNHANTLFLSFSIISSRLVFFPCFLESELDESQNIVQNLLRTFVMRTYSCIDVWCFFVWCDDRGKCKA